MNLSVRNCVNQRRLSMIRIHGLKRGDQTFSKWKWILCTILYCKLKNNKKTYEQKTKHTSVMSFTHYQIRLLCRVYTRTHVARKNVSRTSNMYPYMSTDTCRRIQVARSGYMLTVSRRHNYYSFTSRSTCMLYPFVSSNRRATNWRQFCRRYKKHVDGDKWIQLVSGNMCPGLLV